MVTAFTEFTLDRKKQILNNHTKKKLQTRLRCMNRGFDLFGVRAGQGDRMFKRHVKGLRVACAEGLSYSRMTNCFLDF